MVELFEGRGCGGAGKRYRFVKDTERLVFEACGLGDGMQRDLVVRENAIVR